MRLVRQLVSVADQKNEIRAEGWYNSKECVRDCELCILSVLSILLHEWVIEGLYISTPCRM